MSDSDDSGKIPCFVGIHEECGRIMACAVDRPEHKNRNAQIVCGLILDGYTIEKRPVAEVRVAEWCDCKRKKKSDG